MYITLKVYKVKLQVNKRWSSIKLC